MVISAAERDSRVMPSLRTVMGMLHRGTCFEVERFCWILLVLEKAFTHLYQMDLRRLTTHLADSFNICCFGDGVDTNIVI
jgi:hypothetical protein